MKKNDYYKLIEKHFPKYRYLNLRILFDPQGDEWREFSFEKKIKIIEDITQIIPLEVWLDEYINYYTVVNKKHIIVDLPEALFIYLKYFQTIENKTLFKKIKDYLISTNLEILPCFQRAFNIPIKEIVSILGEEFNPKLEKYLKDLNEEKDYYSSLDWDELIREQPENKEFYEFMKSLYC